MDNQDIKYVEQNVGKPLSAHLTRVEENSRFCWVSIKRGDENGILDTLDEFAVRLSPDKKSVMVTASVPCNATKYTHIKQLLWSDTKTGEEHWSHKGVSFRPIEQEMHSAQENAELLRILPLKNDAQFTNRAYVLEQCIKQGAIVPTNEDAQALLAQLKTQIEAERSRRKATWNYKGRRFNPEPNLGWRWTSNKCDAITVEVEPMTAGGPPAGQLKDGRPYWLRSRWANGFTHRITYYVTVLAGRDVTIREIDPEKDDLFVAPHLFKWQDSQERGYPLITFKEFEEMFGIATTVDEWEPIANKYCEWLDKLAGEVVELQVD